MPPETRLVNQHVSTSKKGRPLYMHVWMVRNPKGIHVMRKGGPTFSMLRPHARKPRHRNYSKTHPGEKRRRYRARKRAREAIHGS